MGELFGDYELGPEIARGGMGVVRRGRQISLNRPVALKMIATGQFASPALVERFQIEAAAAARLDHPSIVPIYEIGEHRGQVYYSMKMVEGGSLATRLADPGRGVSPRQSAQWLIDLAEATEFAHQHGVLHRDLKPSNVLIESTGRACIADFGLAKVVEDESGITLSTATLGTPAYMSPEQAEGRSRDVSTASDIYSLGAILYELLAGRPPFQGETAVAVMRQVIEHEPAPPHLVNPSIPRDLEKICLKCLQKEPARRYASACDLAEDLRSFLRDEPVKARPVTRAERAWRWCRRKPALAALGGTAIVLLLCVTIGGPVGAYRINLERNEALTARANEAKLRDKAQAQAYTADMNNVLQAWNDGNLKLARDLLDRHRPKPGEIDRRGFEWRYLSHLCQDQAVRRIPAEPKDPIWRLATTPNHSFVAVAGERTLRLLDCLTGQVQLRLPYFEPESNETFHLIALAAQATNLVAAHRADGLVSVWDLQTKRPPVIILFSNRLGAMALSPNGRLLGGVEHHGQERTIRLFDISSNPPHQIWSLSLAPSATSAPKVLEFSPDGQTLVTDARSWTEGTFVAWDIASRRELEPFPKRSSGIIHCLAFSPDRALLASSGVDSAITLLNFTNRTMAFSLDEHVGRVNSLAFSPDGRRLASGCGDGSIRLWDLASKQMVGILRDPKAREIRSLVFAPDGKSVFSATDAGLSIWKAEPRQPADTVATDQEWGGNPTFSPDGRWMVTVGATNWNEPILSSARVWDTATHRERFRLALRKQEFLAPVFSPDGKYFALGSETFENVIGVWDTAEWEKATAPVEASHWLTNNFEVCSLAFSPDGKTLAAGGLCFHPLKPSGATNRLAFWRVGSWRELNLLPDAGTGDNQYTAAATVDFSKDGQWLAVGYRDGAVRLWDFKRQRLIAKLLEQQGHGGYGASVTFSSDDRWLVSVALNSSLALYDMSNPICPRLALKSDAHFEPIWSAAFSPDNRTLASSGSDGLVRLWNLETLNVALTLDHSYGPGVFVGFSPQGNLLVSKDSHGVVKWWVANSVSDPNQ